MEELNNLLGDFDLQDFEVVDFEAPTENPPGENPPGENPPGENPPGETEGETEGEIHQTGTALDIFGSGKNAVTLFDVVMSRGCTFLTRKFTKANVVVSDFQLSTKEISVLSAHAERSLKAIKYNASSVHEPLILALASIYTTKVVSAMTGNAVQDVVSQRVRTSELKEQGVTASKSSRYVPKYVRDENGKLVKDENGNKIINT
jgi:hypothetical protein